MSKQMAIGRRTPWTLDYYQKQALRTAGEHIHPTLYGALAVAGEAGELADMIKKRFFHGIEVPSSQIALEIGDVLWGLGYLAHYCGYTLEDIAKMNVKKLLDRYPDGFVNGGGKR